jgi:hypothetical protein
VKELYGQLMDGEPRGYQLDEYPYASTEQGGFEALAAPVFWIENSFQGTTLGAFYGSLVVRRKRWFLVLPIPV